MCERPRPSRAKRREAATARFEEMPAEDGRGLSGHVVAIPSPIVAQAAAAAGADLLIFDREHGALDRASRHACAAATQGFDCIPGIRPPQIDAAQIDAAQIHEAQAKRALDRGVEAV